MRWEIISIIWHQPEVRVPSLSHSSSIKQNIPTWKLYINFGQKNNFKQYSISYRFNSINKQVINLLPDPLIPINKQLINDPLFWVISKMIEILILIFISIIKLIITSDFLFQFRSCRSHDLRSSADESRTFHVSCYDCFFFILNSSSMPRTIKLETQR